MGAKRNVKKVKAVRLKNGCIVTDKKNVQYDFAVVPEYDEQRLIKLTLYDNAKKCYDPICVTEAVLNAYAHDCQRQQTNFILNKAQLKDHFVKNINRNHLTRQMGMEIKKFMYCIYMEALEKDLFYEIGA